MKVHYSLYDFKKITHEHQQKMRKETGQTWVYRVCECVCVTFRLKCQGSNDLDRRIKERHTHTHSQQKADTNTRLDTNMLTSFTHIHFYKLGAHTQVQHATNTHTLTHTQITPCLVRSCYILLKLNQM